MSDGETEPIVLGRPSGAPAVFLVPRTYRRRRLGDAARLLPVLGAALVLLPALGLFAEQGGARLVYLGAVWIGLILAAAALGRALLRAEADRPSEDGAEPPA